MTTKKAQPQKRGVKNHFTGSKFEFLTSHVDEYVSLRGRNRQQFWHKLFAAWWEKYPWHLADHEEPPTDDLKKMEELAHVGGDGEEKGKVEERLRSKITSWFAYQATVHNSPAHEGGVWSPILKRIHQQLNTKPRCRSVAQQFMHENPQIVNAAFVALYGEGRGMDRTERLNKWNEVAKRLVTTTYKNQTAELERRAKETNKRDLEEWGLELAGIERAEDVESARDSLFSAVSPLLKLIGGYTGCYVTLLAAAPDNTDGKPYFSTAHYFPQDGDVRVNWTDFDKQGFKDGVVRSFFKYIRWMEGSEGEKTTSTPPAAIETPSATQSAVPPAAIPSTTISTSQQPGRYKKRPFVYTEDTSEEEDDMSMDNIEDNNSSGSSVDSNHVPAKHLRTSITTCSSKATSAAKEPVTDVGVRQVSPTIVRQVSPTVIRQVSPATVRDHPPGLGNTNTEPEPEIADASVPSFSGYVSPVDDITLPRTKPTASHPNLTDMDTDEAHTSQKTHNTTGVGVDPVRELLNTQPVTQSQSPPPGPDSEPKIPGFLKGKHNIYSYLSAVEERGFQDLLKIYIKFEYANRSDIRGVLPTVRRPKAIAWWSGRARPHKLPPYDSLKSFTHSIIQWWITIQPRWREIEPGVVSRVEGDWECLYQPGINGFLNVIVLAHWWARILRERDSPVDDTYSWFISDVSWVLSQLTGITHDL